MTSQDDPSELNMNTRLALVRTRLAFERTLMAWVRTSVSLITFGFTLYKAFEYLGQHQSAGDRGRSFAEARHFGVIMILMGVGALLAALVEHLRHVKKARALDRELPVFSVAAAVALLFAAIGMWLLIRTLGGEHHAAGQG